MKKVLDFLVKLVKTIPLKINEWLEWLRMKKLRRMEISRDDWKEKARIRADELREFRKAKRKDREKINLLAQEIKLLEEKLKKKNFP